MQSLHTISPQSSIQTCLIPYIPPPSAPTAAHEDTLPQRRQDILRMDISELDYILELNDSGFWSTLIWPIPITDQSVIEFIASYLRRRSIVQKWIQHNPLLDPAHAEKLISDLESDEEESLLSVVYHLCCRILSGPPADFDVDGEIPWLFDTMNIPHKKIWNKRSWRSALCDPNHSIFSLDTFLDFLTIFEPTNRPHLQQLLSSSLFAQNVPIPWIETVLRGINDMSENVKALKKRSEKGKSRSKGKGKSKAVDEEAITTQITHGLDQLVLSPSNEFSFRENIIQLITFLDTLTNLIWTSTQDFSRELGRNHALIELLISLHELATLYMSEFMLSSNNFIEKSVFDFICKDEDIMRGDFNVPVEALLSCRFLKRSVIDFMEGLTMMAFFQALETISDVANGDEIVNELCDFLIHFVDTCILDGPVLILTNAPLLVDFALLFDLETRIQSITNYNQSHLNGKMDETRLEYLRMSLEHFITFSGNAETREWLKEANQPVLSESTSLNTTLHASLQFPNTNTQNQEHDIEKTTQISAIQDLFPDLHERFIEAYLLEYHGDQEMVIMKIIEDDFPPHLKKLKIDPGLDISKAVVLAAPKSTTLSQPDLITTCASQQKTLTHDDSILKSRRNVFDGDQFDVFSGNVPDPSRVIDRRNERRKKLKDVKDSDFVAMNKSYILSRTFDEYDDEYDDTYDSSDIKLAGAIDIHVGDEDAEAGLSQLSRKRLPSEAKEEYQPSEESKLALEQESQRERYLVEIYQSRPSLFDPGQRKSKGRQEMRDVTGWSHEQIEGWFKMLDRNPRQRDRLLQKYEWRGNKPIQEPKQQDLESDSETSNQNDGDSSNSRGGRPRGRGGRGGIARGRGSSSYRGGTGSRGHHNGRGRGSRKDAHAKKMARGMNKPEF